jgi:histidyl-tRNA synthetase
VRALLDDAGVAYDLDPTLVRGLDYYTRTVFEFESPSLGAQSGVGGGGRYDGLVSQLGGPATPGVGWAAGVERILLAGSAAPAPEPPVYVAIADRRHRRAAFALARDLRGAGMAAQVEQAGRSMKGQMKHAGRLEAFAVVIVGDEIEVKDMGTGEQVPVADAREAIAVVTAGAAISG